MCQASLVLPLSFGGRSSLGPPMGCGGDSDYKQYTENFLKYESYRCGGENEDGGPESIYQENETDLGNPAMHDDMQ